MPEPRPATVIYVHGIFAKPAKECLTRQWNEALFGPESEPGDRTRMAYWSDLRYGPAEPAPPGSDCASLGRIGSAYRSAAQLVEQVQDEFRGNPAAQAFIERLGTRMEAAALLQDDAEVLRGEGPATDLAGDRGPRALQMHARVLPGYTLRRKFTRWLTGQFLRDVAAYFYEPQDRRDIRNRLRELLVPGAGPYLVIGHSLGSVIAYDLLREYEQRDDLRITHFISIGSPLGMREVQDNLCLPDEAMPSKKHATAAKRNRKVPAQLRHWYNFADRLDPVALDADLDRDLLSREFKPGNRVTNEGVINRSTLSVENFNPHAGAGYLATSDVRDCVREIVGRGFAGRISDFVVARDLAADLLIASERHPVLIELDLHPGSGAAAAGEVAALSLAERAAHVRRSILSIVKRLNPEPADPPETAAGAAEREAALEERAGIDVLQRYVAARLTRAEIDLLAAQHREIAVSRVWRDARKSALCMPRGPLADTPR